MKTVATFILIIIVVILVLGYMWYYKKADVKNATSVTFTLDATSAPNLGAFAKGTTYSATLANGSWTTAGLNGGTGKQWSAPWPAGTPGVINSWGMAFTLDSNNVLTFNGVKVGTYTILA